MAPNDVQAPAETGPAGTGVLLGVEGVGLALLRLVGTGGLLTTTVAGRVVVTMTTRTAGAGLVSGVVRGRAGAGFPGVAFRGVVPTVVGRAETGVLETGVLEADVLEAGVLETGEAAGGTELDVGATEMTGEVPGAEEAGVFPPAAEGAPVPSDAKEGGPLDTAEE